MTEYDNHFRPTGWLVPIMQWAKMAGRVNHQTEWFCLINGTRDAWNGFIPTFKNQEKQINLHLDVLFVEQTDGDRLVYGALRSG